MCGIYQVFGAKDSEIDQHLRHLQEILPRGPDTWRLECNNKILKRCILGFTRLRIVGDLSGMQPMRLVKYPQYIQLCNGEQYNYKILGDYYKLEYETNCDVECIIKLYHKFKDIKKVFSLLDGVFACTLIDLENKVVHVARDPYGVRPLFYFDNKLGNVGICSVSKGLIDMSKKSNTLVHTFPPSHIYTWKLDDDGNAYDVSSTKYYTIGTTPNFVYELKDYYKQINIDDNTLIKEPIQTVDILHTIRELLYKSVKKRLMSERQVGCLLSGGQDSSLIASLLVKASNELNLPYKIQSFSIGMEGSPDLKASREVANMLNTEHHEIIFTENDVYENVSSVIYELETFDITTIRASIGMYLLSKYIKENTNTVVILSGEGADELCQGYIYFRNSPNVTEAHNESLRLLNDIYLYDGLRADRTTASQGLELRVPFLDLQFSSYILQLPIELRTPKDGIEKYLLRKAFENSQLIPDSILWRTKEAFSDGVTTVRRSLFHILHEISLKYLSKYHSATDKIIIDDEEKKDDSIITTTDNNQLINLSLDEQESILKKFYKQYEYHLPPKTIESLYYRLEFEKYYPFQGKLFTPYFWMPKWCNVKDPSARFLDIYKSSN